MYQPLFTAFGPAAIESRVTAAGGSKAKLVVTDVANRPKLKDVPDCPDILTVGDDFAEAIEPHSTDFAPVMLKGSDPFVVLFTSGTTGKPKGVRYPLALLYRSPPTCSTRSTASGRQLLERRRSRMGLRHALRGGRAADARPRHDLP